MTLCSLRPRDLERFNRSHFLLHLHRLRSRLLQFRHLLHFYILLHFLCSGQGVSKPWRGLIHRLHLLHRGNLLDQPRLHQLLKLRAWTIPSRNLPILLFRL